jgi:transketolase
MEVTQGMKMPNSPAMITILTAFSGAMGMAAIGVALWRYNMKYSPNNADWFNRDRFVLSNGKFLIQP